MKEVVRGFKRGLVVCAALFAGILVAAIIRMFGEKIADVWEEVSHEN